MQKRRPACNHLHVAAVWQAFPITKPCYLRIISPYFLLIVFFASQYVKHISYAECQIQNYFSSGSSGCDCEKIFTKRPVTRQTSLPPLTHFHQHNPDEPFVPESLISFRFDRASSANREWKRVWCTLSRGFARDVENPPRSAAHGLFVMPSTMV